MALDALDLWVRRIRDGDRTALAKAITLAESDLPKDRNDALNLLAQAASRPSESLRLAITGPPGAGKSTLIEALGMEFISKGLRVAVLSIDPSSPRTGGSILGDKTRMQSLSSHSRAFVRPSPSQGASGGVAPRTHDVITLAEAAGYHVVIIETVGVGQSEYAVAGMADAVLLVMIPGAGDGIQAMKRGILDVADAVVVNKCDGSSQASAQQVCEEVHQALLLRSSVSSGEPIWVACCSALTLQGIPELAAHWIRFREKGWADGWLPERRRDQARVWIRHQLGGRDADLIRMAESKIDSLNPSVVNEYEILLYALG